ncbi:MAG TPA: hypothetical protein DCL31_05685 [Clostridium sp.]|nr:hypothetical protein [Clostridium sp.]
MPKAGEIRSKSSLVTDLKTLERIMDSFYDVFAKDVNVFTSVVSDLLSMVPVFGYAVSGVSVTQTLSSSEKINYSKAAYETLRTAYRAMANGEANSVSIFQDFVWVYQGKNKQYWKLTGRLTTILD